MCTASKRFAFQLSPALAAASRASVNVDVPASGKGSVGIALDTEAGETTAGEGVVDTLTAPDVVVAATGKRDANQALATSDCWD